MAWEKSEPCGIDMVNLLMKMGWLTSYHVKMLQFWIDMVNLLIKMG